ncbi:cellulose synthase/poly-beta-1,6-N-acetylglucosamine synthase-like glycosyltransferase [Pseudaminobacter salicylatoxidans]|uniref:Cellulose synthase/poly-beta-1,6-N-acetylglucosamine synthase-like glycosyltransferase n=1 Tax=Pseudaminobacter salicylatoxidans TaxID=93369 RepID=A0A316C0U1_PSESE|nr:glycosyltransferase family 2 protein [Pseudaminobacter salicylatoxidans]PWJ81636.1 cellulose synthase/poly-beta-1,6-N-acetylglucosamine synthase-like glycosyltransferase [Pseudaminobacter salicylatoxidans]
MALIDVSAHGWRAAPLPQLKQRRAGARDAVRAGAPTSQAFSGHAEWRPLIERMGLPSDAALRIAMQANVNDTDFQSELLASGAVSEEAFFRALADDLGLPFVSRIDPDKLIIREEQCLMLLRRNDGRRLVKVEEADGIAYLVAPERTRISVLHALLRRNPGVRGRLRATTTGELRSALLKRAEQPLMRIAVRDLFDRYPEYSARIGITAWQGMVWGVLVTAFVIAMVLARDIAYAVAHGLFSLCFIACIALRFVAARFVTPPLRPRISPAERREMPVYSVLIALYDEAVMVPSLLAALERIEWPRSKLEIKLCCEADDRSTLAAIRACALPSHIEVIETPPHALRTKPKALSYALPVTRGDLIVLYDAEDRPHPAQLIEAWQRFRDRGPELACVQAPLEIANREASVISRMFFFEYATLFRGLLPWLSRRGLMLPLGGTSNHFRREALEAVGGWDPYNVTEDADLGLRLTRCGYRAETIDCPTLEDAPEDFGTWLPQRTRWFKGWVQTWLVHMRNPGRLAEEVGWGSYAVAQVLFAGLIVSAMMHPLLAVMLLDVLVDIRAGQPLGAWRAVLLPFDMANIAFGYISFLLLGWYTLRSRERRGFWKIILFVPVYWLMISAAAWRAIWQFWRCPHHWEKTPHRSPAPFRAK